MWPWPKRTDEDFREEIQANIALDTDRFIAEGMNREQARAAARRAFGNVTRAQEQFYVSRRVMWLDDLQRDLRYAVRTLLRAPSFAAVAVLTLALGIGATTVVFSVVDSVLLNPAPFKDSLRLAEIWRWSSRGGGPFQPARTLPRWREQSQIFEQVEAHWEGSFVISGDDEPRVIWGSQVTVGLFGMLGARPALGRDFVPDESNYSRVVIISHGLWTRRFGGDVGAVGKTLRLNDAAYTIVGVMPAAFRFPVGQVEVWIPFDPSRPNPLSSRGSVTPLVRVRADVPFTQANEQVSLLAPRLDDSLAGQPPDMTARLQTMNRYSSASLGGKAWSAAETRTALFLIFGAAGLVLLVSAANAANLFLSRGLSRGQDLAVRAALGGGRWRLVRHLLAEASVVALLAGALGILMAAWALGVVAALVPMDFVEVSLNPIDLDARAATWSIVVTMLVGLLAAIIPAFQSVRGDIATQLKKGSDHGGVRGPMAFRALLVSLETGLAVVLLVGAGLTARSLWTLLHTSPGWSADGLVIVEPQFENGRYGFDARADYFTRLLASLVDHPGVQSAAIAEGVPLEPSGLWLGRLETGASSTPEVELTNLRVSESFFRTMEIPIRDGRAFATGETGPVAIVSASIAQQLWGGEAPLGRSFRFENSAELLTVVGVADDVQMQAFDFPTETMEIYRPLRSAPGPASVNQYHYAVLRTDPRAGLIPTLKQRALAIDPNLPVQVTPMGDVFRDTLAEPEFQAHLLIGFGAIALLLASAGVFAVVSYETSRRSQEIGIRIALGATRAAVIRQVMGRSMRLATIGAVAGIGAAFALTRFMSSMLHGVQPTDPVAFVGATAFLLFAAGLAAYVPARRATRVDPLVALRCD